MKKVLFAVMIVSLLVGLVLLIPNDPSTAYPIPTSKPPITPVPPTYVYPAWFATNCSWPLGNPTFGHAGSQWWQPASYYTVESGNPGYFIVYTYDGDILHSVVYYDWILENFVSGVQILLGQIWLPHYGMRDELRGYVRVIDTRDNTTHYITMSPDPFILNCTKIHLPYVRK